MIYYLLYIGVAKNKFEQEDFDELLLQARSRNEFLGITGKLLHCEGTFIQLLEGAEESVNDIYRSIRNDKRLLALKTIIMGNAKERYYQNWSMGFKDVSAEEINELEHCNHPNVAEYIRTAAAVRLLKLLAKA